MAHVEGYLVDNADGSSFFSTWNKDRAVCIKSSLLCVCFYGTQIVNNVPINSITRTKLVTIVPPVALADRKRITRNNQNHGENAAAVPVMTWIVTAHANGPRRPNLNKK